MITLNIPKDMHVTIMTGLEADRNARVSDNSSSLQWSEAICSIADALYLPGS